MDSAPLSVTTLTPDEDPGPLEKIYNGILNLVVPSRDGNNGLIEVWWEATNNVVSLFPGVGIFSALVSFPIDVIQLVIAGLQGNWADVEDEQIDIVQNVVRALQPFRGSVELLQIIDDAVR